jgi:hypothetical protein
MEVDDEEEEVVLVDREELGELVIETEDEDVEEGGAELDWELLLTLELVEVLVVVVLETALRVAR